MTRLTLALVLLMVMIAPIVSDPTPSPASIYDGPDPVTMQQPTSLCGIGSEWRCIETAYGLVCEGPGGQTCVVYR